MKPEDTYEPMTQEALETELRRSRDLARVAKGRYDAYVEAGFSSHEALRLTLNWQSALLGGDG